MYGIRRIAGENKPGLSLNPALIHTGGNSGYQALNLVYHFGVSRVLLIGYDMQKTGNRSHWHGDHPAGLHRSSPYSEWVRRFKRLAADLKQAGVEVINCSEHTALPYFPRARLEDVL
jgi:hypothetical protein